MTPCDVLNKLRNAISATQLRDYCISRILLSNVPTSVRRSTVKIGGWAEVESMHETRPLWCLQNILTLFTPPLWRPSRQCHKTIPCTQSICQCCEKNAMWIVISGDSAMLEGGTASYGNVPAFPCGITAKSVSVKRYKVRKSFPKLLLVITSLSVTLRLHPTWKSWVTDLSLSFSLPKSIHVHVIYCYFRRVYSWQHFSLRGTVITAQQAAPKSIINCLSIHGRIMPIW